jgi:hypothetical protein
LHSTHTRNDSSTLFRLGEAKAWWALTQLPQNSLPQCRQWCRRQYMLNAWPQLPHVDASSSRCHRSRGSGTAGHIPAAATVCAGADASSPTGGSPSSAPGALFGSCSGSGSGSIPKALWLLPSESDYATGDAGRDSPATAAAIASSSAAAESSCSESDGRCALWPELPRVSSAPS